MRVEVAVIGGGVVGASVAYHLAVRGCRDVLVIEREGPAAGSTGRATGGARAVFGHPANVRLSRLGLEFLARARELLGDDCGHDPVGYLFLLPAAAERQWRPRFEAARALGVDLRALPSDRLRDLVPGLSPEGLAGGYFTPEGATFDPARLNRALVRRAEELGVRVWTGVEVRALATAHGRAVGVETARGRVEARAVVLAAGVWSAALAATAGVPLPVVPLRRQLCLTEPLPGPAFPVVIDPVEALVLRRRDGGILFGVSRADERPGFITAGAGGWADRGDADSSAGGPRAPGAGGGPPSPGGQGDPPADPDWDRRARAVAARRLPALANLRVARCWAGYYEMTPDANALLGPHPDLDGLYVATGFSGHGVMHAPAAGRLLAEWLLDGAPRSADASPYAPDRFHRGLRVEDPFVV